MEDDASSDASGDTIDLNSPEPSPEKRLSDHMLISEAAFSPQSSGALHSVLANLEARDVDINAADDAGYTTLMACAHPAARAQLGRSEPQPEL